MGFAIINNPPTIDLNVVVSQRAEDIVSTRGQIVSWVIEAANNSLTTLKLTLKAEHCIVDRNADVTRVLTLPGMWDSAVVVSGMTKVTLDYEHQMFIKIEGAVRGWFESHENAVAHLMKEKLENANKLIDPGNSLT